MPHRGSCCDAACSDLEVDSRNCGGCGLACPEEDVCLNGSCTPSASCATETDSTACLLPSGEQGLCCGGSCVDVETDSDHCTGCYLACPLGSTCAATASPSAPFRGTFLSQCVDSSGVSQSCGSWATSEFVAASPCPTGYGCAPYRYQSQEGFCQPTSCAGISDNAGTNDLSQSFPTAAERTGNDISCYLTTAEDSAGKCCGGVCVDVLADSNNCGTCGAACPPGFTCSGFSCVADGGDAPLQCGPGVCPAGSGCVDSLLSGTVKCFPRSCSGRSDGTACGFGSDTVGTCCAGACVETLEDSANCGACGVDCRGGLCIGGACEAAEVSTCVPNCPAGQLCFQGTCVGPVCGEVAPGCPVFGNTRSGQPPVVGCYPACLGGDICVQGTCVGYICNQGFVCMAQDDQLGLCCPDGSCIDPASDPNNCGGCGVSCKGEPCVDGACSGAPCGFSTQGKFCGSLTDSDSVCCGASCVDTAADDANCGACGNVCPSGMSCRSGTCQ